MPSNPVVEALGVLKDGLLSVCPTCEGRTFTTLSLERSEKRLSHGIIIAIACPAHADCDIE
jgi:hypothetical protein